MVTAYAALPCPEVPDLHALQAAQDARQSLREARAQLPFTESQTLSWMPRMPAGIYYMALACNMRSICHSELIHEVITPCTVV